jgi:hypothetical protein
MTKILRKSVSGCPDCTRMIVRKGFWRRYFACATCGRKL